MTHPAFEAPLPSVADGPMPPNGVLEVNGLTKLYGSFRAVDGISFSVPKGKVIGLLGPNGAGKTTTIHMLVGTTLPDGGTISYFGKELRRNREYCLQRINFTSSFNTLQGRISVWENLLVFAYLYSLKRPERQDSRTGGVFRDCRPAPAAILDAVGWTEDSRQSGQVTAE